MDHAAIYNVFVSGVSICALVYLGWWVYPLYRIDLFRQEIFSLRDELFDLAADGQIGFDNPAYLKLRRLMNKTARFGHRATMPQLLAWRFFMGARVDADEKTFHDQFILEVEALSPDAYKVVWGIYTRYRLAVLEQLVVGSLTFLIPALVPALLLVAGLLVAQGVRRIKEIGKQFSGWVEAAALHA